MTKQEQTQRPPDDTKFPFKDLNTSSHTNFMLPCFHQKRALHYRCSHSIGLKHPLYISCDSGKKRGLSNDNVKVLQTLNIHPYYLEQCIDWKNHRCI